MEYLLPGLAVTVVRYYGILGTLIFDSETNSSTRAFSSKTAENTLSVQLS